MNKKLINEKIGLSPLVVTSFTHFKIVDGCVTECTCVMCLSPSGMNFQVTSSDQQESTVCAKCISESKDMRLNRDADRLVRLLKNQDHDYILEQHIKSKSR